MADRPKDLSNIIITQVENPFYLTQRNNVNTLSEKRDKEPNNQCMIATFGEWGLQFGHYANIEKWKIQFNERTIEEVIHTIVQTRINKLNEPILARIDELAKKGASAIAINAEKRKLKNRYSSEHFRSMFDEILDEYGWKMTFSVATVEKIISVIDSGQSVIAGTNISKYLKGASGHIQNFVGYYKEKSTGKLLGLISNDPYGDCETKYTNHNGKERFYNMVTTNNLLTPCGEGDKRLIIYAVRK